MVVMEIRFPAGRYHATPWGRNVNEGVPEWPPSPFRLARALLDAAFRKYPDWPTERLEAVLEVVASPVRYRLPPVTTSHSRSYLSANEKTRSSKNLIIDAFVAVDRRESVLMAFDADPPREVVFDLRRLSGFLNYLGRSESWVSLDVLEDPDEDGFNCVPAEETSAGKGRALVDLACLRSKYDYQNLIRAIVPDGDEIPYTWIGAACLSTSELLRQGWSEPPALQRMKYSLPDKLVDGTPPPRAVVRPRREPTIARYQLTSKVLPLLTEALPIAERARAKLMGIHKRMQGGDPGRVSPLFSGKQPDGRPLKGHRHAFVMPRDEDGDGRIDHLVVYCSEGFGRDEVAALDSFGSMWQSGGRPDIRATLLSLSDEPQTPKATGFVSHTPFVTKRHYRKGRGPFLEWLRGEIERECVYHNLPRPTDLQWRRSTPGPGHRFRWLEFTRSRKGEMPLHGYGCRLTFPEPLRGPVALGSYCHFGLGQFTPAAED